MPAYPTDIPTLREAILLYTPNVVEAQGAYNDALLSVSIVTQSGAIFDALSPHVDDLDTDGLRVLAGVCRAIAQNSWLGKSDAAFSTLADVLPLISEDPAPVEP